MPLIEAAFYARVASGVEDDQTRWRATRPAPASTSPTSRRTAPRRWTRRRRSEEAERIAVPPPRGVGIRGGDGSLTWLTPVVVHQCARLRHPARWAPVSTTGPQASGSSSAPWPTSPASAAARRGSPRRRTRDRRRPGRGGGRAAARRDHRSGASMVWALVQLAACPRRARRFVLRARTASAPRSPPERIAEDRAFDLSAGNAGALLAFLCLYDDDRRGGVAQSAPARAAACSSRTARIARPPGRGPRGRRSRGCRTAWPASHTRCSHSAPGPGTITLRRRGAGGAALRAPSLPACGRQLGRPAPGRAVAGAEGHARVVQWRSRNRPGPVALAEPSTSRRRPTSRWPIATTRRHASGAQDHLCCGTLGTGRVAAPRGHRPRAPRAGGRSTRGHRSGRGARPEPRPLSLLVARSCRRSTVPGVFRGLAGAGLQLLRIAEPDRVASPLLLD